MIFDHKNYSLGKIGWIKKRTIKIAWRMEMWTSIYKFFDRIWIQSRCFVSGYSFSKRQFHSSYWRRCNKSSYKSRSYLVCKSSSACRLLNWFTIGTEEIIFDLVLKYHIYCCCRNKEQERALWKLTRIEKSNDGIKI